jgi:putative peptidoglycan lipid II flippase
MCLPNSQPAVSSPFSRHRQLILGMLTVLGLSALAKLGGAFKEIVLAGRFGTSALMDQFIFGFTVASLPASLLSSILILSLTPVLSRFESSASKERADFFAQLWGACIALSLVLATVSWLIFPYLSPVASAGGAELAAMVGIVTFVFCLSALATAILVGMGRQIGSLLEGVPSIVLGSVVLSGIWSSEHLLVVGLVVGVVLQLLALSTAQWRYAGPVRVALPVPSPHWKQLFSGLGFTSAGYGLLVLTMAVEINIASHFETGSAASLGYANRLTAMVIGLLLPAVNRVAVVHFCDARNRHVSPWQACASVLLPFVLVGLVVSAVMIFFAPDIVWLFYERGRFDAQATDAVSHLMRWHISQLAPSLAAAVLFSYLSATGGFRSIFFGCASAFVSEIVFAWWGSEVWGMDAVAAAPMVGRVVLVAYLVVVVRRKNASLPATTISPPLPT